MGTSSVRTPPALRGYDGWAISPVFRKAARRGMLPFVPQRNSVDKRLARRQDGRGPPLFGFQRAHDAGGKSMLRTPAAGKARRPLGLIAVLGLVVTFPGWGPAAAQAAPRRRCPAPRRRPSREF